MRKLGLLVAALLGMSLMVTAQTDKKPQSPAREATAMLGDTKLAITYGAPSVRGREIWGGLVPYDKVWRTGANAATTFETSSDVLINGKQLPAGKYALFTIPGREEWTVIFNKTSDQWGAYRYNDKEDQLRIAVKPGKAAQQEEELKFTINARGDRAAAVTMAWDQLAIGFNVERPNK